MTTREIFFVICNNCGEEILEEEAIYSGTEGTICNSWQITLKKLTVIRFG